jgi:adenylate cyclase class 2
VTRKEQILLEVERKYRIADRDSIRIRVQSLGGRWAAAITQNDRYFAHPVRDFAATDEALRVRSVGPLNVITYKGPKIDRESKTREEIEIGLEDGEAAAKELGAILLRLGFKAVLTVTKSREIAKIEWQNSEVEIALDEVTGAGLFVELETQAAEADLEIAKACIHSLATALGLAEEDQERRSYLELVLSAKPK